MGPGRGRPDDDADVPSCKLGELLRSPRHGIGDIDRGRGFVPILDLPSRQGRLAVNAPVDGLQPAIHQPLLHHVGKGAELQGLEAGVQGDVGLVPLAEHPQPLELLALDVQVVQRGSRAFFAQLQRVR